MSSAILLIAHGSRRPEANRDLVVLAEMVRQRRREEIVEIAYLELASPTIPEGVQKCVEQGAKGVRMLPYFLSQGAHVNEDLMEFQRRFQQEFPGVEFRVCPPLGLHPKIVDVLLERLDERGELSGESG